MPVERPTRNQFVWCATCGWMQEPAVVKQMSMMLPERMFDHSVLLGALSRLRFVCHTEGSMILPDGTCDLLAIEKFPLFT